MNHKQILILKINIFLSFMIAKIFSRSRPENNPSAESMSPSQWMPPVKIISDTKATAPANIGKPKKFTEAVSAAQIAPRIAPIAGKNFTDSPKLCSVHTLCLATKIRVKNCSPTRKEFIRRPPLFRFLRSMIITLFVQSY